MAHKCVLSAKLKSKFLIEWGALSQNTNAKTWIPKIVYLRVKRSLELNGLSILNKKGINGSKEMFALKKSDYIWIWKGIHKEPFAVA